MLFECHKFDLSFVVTVLLFEMISRWLLFGSYDDSIWLKPCTPGWAGMVPSFLVPQAPFPQVPRSPGPPPPGPTRVGSLTASSPEPRPRLFQLLVSNRPTRRVTQLFKIKSRGLEIEFCVPKSFVRRLAYNVVARLLGLGLGPAFGPKF